MNVFRAGNRDASLARVFLAGLRHERAYPGDTDSDLNGAYNLGYVLTHPREIPRWWRLRRGR